MSAHIALIPSAGMLHIIPVIQLAMLLSTHHQISSTLMLTPTKNMPEEKLRSMLNNTLPQNCDYTFLPAIVDKEGIALEQLFIDSIVTSESIIMSNLEGIRKLDGGPKLVALVVEPFGVELTRIAKNLGLPTYVFFASAAMNLLFLINLPKIDNEAPPNIDNFEQLPNPIMLPGCPPLYGRDFGQPFLLRRDPVFKAFLDQSRKISEVDGILINTFDAFEPNATAALREFPPKKLPTVYPVGPLMNKFSADQKCEGEECEVLGWLDTQPKASVLLLTFGSGGSLTMKQTTELANGLEMSGKGFIWALRKPKESFDPSDYIGVNKTEEDPKKYLPVGFLDRVKGRGMVVSHKIIQQRILAHPSTGGFLTNCEWESVLESIVNGVPMITWPLFAEQRTNAVELTDGLKVAIRPQSGPDGVVAKEEVKRVTEELIGNGVNGGAEARNRAIQLKDAAKLALEAGGSSSKALQEVATRLKKV